MARSSHAPSRHPICPSSSPDPLTAVSIAEDSTPCRRRSASIISNQGATATAAATHAYVKHSDIPSPVKMVTEHSASPWRIKVTVEAEPEDRHDGAQYRKARTVMVPLRDEDSSTTEPKPKQRRKSVSKSMSPARVTRSRRQSVTDLDIVVLGDDAEEDAWAKRPRSPRKRANSKSKKGRKAGSDAYFEIMKDENPAGAQEQIAKENSHGKSPEMQELDMNKMHTRRRSNSLKKDPERCQPLRNVSFNSTASYPTPSPTVSVHDFDGDVQERQPVGLDTVMESEGFTMIDLDTLPSVKQMRNTPEYPTIPEETTQNPVVDDSSSNIEAPSIAITNEDSLSHIGSSPPEMKKSRAKPYSIGHLQLPSSTNVQRHRLVTPMPQIVNPMTSPQLPSAPRAPVAATVERSPIHSDQAVQAGTMLQDAVTPEHSLLEDQGVGEARKQEEKMLFGGFSDSMKRELRAELRFGEELGKKQNKSSNEVEQSNLKAEQHAQIWRGETTVQRTPVTTTQNKQATISKAETIEQSEVPDKAWEANKLRIEEEQQREREAVIAEAKQSDVVEIEDDSPEPDSNQENTDETFGDIWLAEARNASSSPREDANPASRNSEPPRRKLIPSPWKRGQQIESSQLSVNDSFNSLMLKQPMKKGGNARFGDALVANPERAARKISDSSRRRSGMYDAEQMVVNTPRRISERIESDESDDDQDIEDENFDAARRQLKWRSATDVIDEETKELEDDNAFESSDKENAHDDITTTKLHETNLEHVPEQDLSSSPQLNLSKDKHQLEEFDHDSTYASGSSEESVDMYRQRNSLSPSKERPNTPRSAMKGTRASFGVALNFAADSDEALSKKVVWAKRSKCMNDLWEESTQSIKSTQTSEATSQSPQPMKPGLHLEPSFEVDPQPVQQEASKGFFGWFQREEKTADPVTKASTQTKPLGLDGSMDHFIKEDEDSLSDSSFVPTARHNIDDTDTIVLRSLNEATEPQPKKQTIRFSDATISCKPNPLPEPPKKPSYLLPPSYPSDPNREPSIPLSTSGPFTTTHFRTLHIIYAKSSRPRFHAPIFPEEIRPEIIDLVGDWTLEIDERTTMGEDGDFVFGVGPKEARVLERFMREIEEGYISAGVGVKWGWTVEELAEKLGRIAVGERVRGEEKISRAILASARKVKAHKLVF